MSSFTQRLNEPAAQRGSNYDNSNRPAESLRIPLQLRHRLEPHTSHPRAHSANFLTQHPPNRLINLHHLHHLRRQHLNPQLLRRGMHCNRVRHRAASFNLAVYAYKPPRRARRTKHPIVVIVIIFVRSNSTRDCGRQRRWTAHRASPAACCNRVQAAGRRQAHHSLPSVREAGLVHSQLASAVG